MKNIISFSGGKDSTAMLFMMIEKGMQIDEIVHFSMGDWEWDEMHRHIAKVKERLPPDIEFTILSDEERKKSDFKKYGFPTPMRRWCSGIKDKTINGYLRSKYPDGYISFLGIAADEVERTKKKYTKKIEVKFPLVDWGITEAEAYEYCNSKGFDWEGLYDDKPTPRVSCWCCPLQRIADIKWLYTDHYDKWKVLREMQNDSFVTFKQDNKTTVFSLEHRFWAEFQFRTKLKKETNQKKLFREAIE